MVGMKSNITRGKLLCFSLFGRCLAWIVIGGALVVHNLQADAATFIGPNPYDFNGKPYYSFADSPFNGLDFSFFYLEDFEDGLLNTPGVSIPSNRSYFLGPFAPSFQTDSVDADDGRIDGVGTSGWSFLANLGYGGAIFNFDSTVLGDFPTHVGLVWTDGRGVGVSGGALADVVFTVYDAYGNVALTRSVPGIGDHSHRGETAEDRFFGVINPAGISAIRIHEWISSGGLEIDHLQYGRLSPIPEPASITLVGMYLIIFACKKLRGLPSDYVRGNTPIVGVGTLLGRGVGTPP